MKRSWISLLAGLATVGLLLVLTQQPVYPNWSSNPQVNDLVATYSNNQNQLQSISDGQGGVYIVWQDNRNSSTTEWDIYAQRLSYNGERLWDEDGSVICNANANQSVPFLVGDGSGGILVFWTDFRDGDLDIYAQRVNSSGLIQWAANGVAVAAGAGAQRFNNLHHYRKYPPIISDNSGGAYFAFMDDSDGDFDIYAQRINGSGAKQWGVNGVKVTNLSRDDRDQRIASDGQGGIFVVWENDQGGGLTSLFAQRVNANGDLMWTPVDGLNIVPDPVPLPVMSPPKPGDPEIVSDGQGGAIILFNTYPGFSLGDLYMQRIDSEGNLLWGNSGKVLSNHEQIEIHYSILRKGGGEFYAIWADQRASYWDGPTFMPVTGYDIYAQKIDLNGNRLWTPETGIPVCVYNGVQYSPEAIVDPFGNLIVGWRDDRNPSSPTGTGKDIYAQMVKSDGTLGWIIGGEGSGTLSGDENGVPVCSAMNDQFEPQLALSSAMGFIITWSDNRDGNTDIYASFVNYTSGLLGGENVVLTVRWLYTQAIQSNENVLIQWSTSWEKDNLEFILYHSVNGADFAQIGQTPGKGEGEFKGISKYQYLHSNPASGLNYYKIRQIDVDGKEEFSPVFSVRFKIAPSIDLFPNPTADRLYIRSEVPIGYTKIFNKQGAVLYQKSFDGVRQIELDLSFLTPGHYIFETRTGYEVNQKAFIKK